MSPVVVAKESWVGQKAFRLDVALVREDDGTWSAIVLNLPGTGSCGDTLEDALNNVREAFSAVAESYEAANKEIPWKDTDGVDIPAGAVRKRIIVNA